MTTYTPYEVPLEAGKNQTFQITLGATVYTLTLVWRDNADGGWTLDISDSAGIPIINGIPLVTGYDLLAQYKHLGISGELIVMSDTTADDVPTFDNLGDASHLYFVTSA